MSPSSFHYPSLSIKSRDVLPLRTSARREAFGVLSELRIEVHIDVLGRMSLRGAAHGSIFLRAFDLSSLAVQMRKSPGLSSFDSARFARR